MIFGGKLLSGLGLALLVVSGTASAAGNIDCMAQNYSAEDLGNIVELGHVNYRVPDQSLATTFYVTGLGLTRDPYMMTGTGNMWVNVGNSQFHLPTGRAVVAPGIVTGLVVPDLAGLRMSGEGQRILARGTEFGERRLERGL